MIQAILPLLGTASAGATAVTSIITALVKILPVVEKLVPIIGDEASLIFTGIKNIIANIRGTQTTAEQDAALDALDARVDAAWNKIAPMFDPDFVNPSNPAPPTPST